jgi:hypothetical protein
VSSGAARWQRSAPTVRALVACGGDEHEVLWRRGALTTAHHDLRGEEAMAALGGEVPACLDIVRAWRAGRVEAAPTPWVWFAHGQGKNRLTARVRPQGDAPLPEPLRRTRLLTLQLGRSLSRDTAGEVAARAQPALVAVLPRGAELAVQGGPGAAHLARHRNRPLLVLPPRWLTHVWARSLDVVGGVFVADAARSPGADGLIEVTALAWEDGYPVLERRRVGAVATRTR